MKRLTERTDRREADVPALAERETPAPAARMLWLQSQVGNRALARYVNPGGGGTPAPPGFADAMKANEWLDGAPMRTLNSLLNLRRSEGAFTEDTFDALVFLDPNGGGVVDDAMLEQLLKRAVDRGLQTQFAHLVEQRAFAGSRLDLSIRFDAGLKTASAVTHEGSLNAVTLGPAAFADLATLDATIGAALPPVMGPAGALAPQVLAGDALKEAVEHNKLAFIELVSGGIVASAIGGHSEDPASEDFAQWVADFQRGRHLPVNGKLDDATMAPIVEVLRGRGHFGSILRLVIDFGSLDRNVIADARYDPTLSAEFAIDRNARGISSATPLENAVTVDFGPKAFNGNLAGIFHTIADAFKQVEARHEGLGEGEQKLLGKAQQLTGFPHRDLQESGAALLADVRDFLAIWRSLKPDDDSRPDPRLRYLPLLRDITKTTSERVQALGLHDVPELRRLKFVLKAMEP